MVGTGEGEWRQLVEDLPIVCRFDSLGRRLDRADGVLNSTPLDRAKLERADTILRDITRQCTLPDGVSPFTPIRNVLEEEILDLRRKGSSITETGFDSAQAKARVEIETSRAEIRQIAQLLNDSGGLIERLVVSTNALVQKRDLLQDKIDRVASLRARSRHLQPVAENGLAYVEKVGETVDAAKEVADAEAAALLLSLEIESQLRPELDGVQAVLAQVSTLVDATKPVGRFIERKANLALAEYQSAFNPDPGRSIASQGLVGACYEISGLVGYDLDETQRGNPADYVSIGYAVSDTGSLLLIASGADQYQFGFDRKLEAAADLGFPDRATLALGHGSTDGFQIGPFTVDARSYAAMLLWVTTVAFDIAETPAEALNPATVLISCFSAEHISELRLALSEIAPQTDFARLFGFPESADPTFETEGNSSSLDSRGDFWLSDTLVRAQLPEIRPVVQAARDTWAKKLLTSALRGLAASGEPITAELIRDRVMQSSPSQFIADNADPDVLERCYSTQVDLATAALQSSIALSFQRPQARLLADKLFAEIASQPPSQTEIQNEASLLLPNADITRVASSLTQDGESLFRVVVEGFIGSAAARQQLTALASVVTAIGPADFIEEFGSRHYTFRQLNRTTRRELSSAEYASATAEVEVLLAEMVSLADTAETEALCQVFLFDYFSDELDGCLDADFVTEIVKGFFGGAIDSIIKAGDIDVLGFRRSSGQGDSLREMRPPNPIVEAGSDGQLQIVRLPSSGEGAEREFSVLQAAEGDLAYEWTDKPRPVITSSCTIPRDHPSRRTGSEASLDWMRSLARGRSAEI